MRDTKYLESFKKNTEKKLKEMNIFKYLEKRSRIMVLMELKNYVIKKGMLTKVKLLNNL
jgi:hypothetical protein